MYFSEEELKQMTLNKLRNAFDEIEMAYSNIYDKYHSSEGTRDDCFLHDLVDSIQGINSVLYVYDRDGEINSGYALEKLKYSKSIIDSTIKYFESKRVKDDEK